MKEPRPVGPKETYIEGLNAIYKKFHAAQHPGWPTTDELTPEGQLTPTAVRELHEALCREQNMNFREIIAEWNRRVPEDQW